MTEPALKLTSDAPKDLVLVTERDWTEMERTMWENFEENIGGILLGAVDEPEKLCVGRFKERSCIITRRVYSEGSDYISCSDPLLSELIVETDVFVYPVGCEYHEEMLVGDFTPEDGRFNIFTGTLPKAHRWVLDSAYPQDVLCGKQITEFIELTCGSIEKICDPWVKKYFKKLRFF